MKRLLILTALAAALLSVSCDYYLHSEITVKNDTDRTLYVALSESGSEEPNSYTRISKQDDAIFIVDDSENYYVYLKDSGRFQTGKRVDSDETTWTITYENGIFILTY